MLIFSDAQQTADNWWGRHFEFEGIFAQALKFPLADFQQNIYYSPQGRHCNGFVPVFSSRWAAVAGLASSMQVFACIFLANLPGFSFFVVTLDYLS